MAEVGQAVMVLVYALIAFCMYSDCGSSEHAQFGMTKISVPENRW